MTAQRRCGGTAAARMARGGRVVEMESDYMSEIGPSESSSRRRIVLVK